MSVHKHPTQALQALTLQEIENAGSDGLRHMIAVGIALRQGFALESGRAALERLARDGRIVFTVEDGEVVTRRAGGGDA